MARIELRTFIRAPEDHVWQVITDLSGQVRWMEDIHKLEIASEVKSGVGTVMNVTTKLFGLPVVRDVMEVVTWERPRKLEVIHKGQLTGSGAFRLQPAPGGTIFLWEEQFDPPLGPLGELAVSAFIAPHLRRVWGRSMDNVRRLAEAGAKPASR
jgi:hypothetical protein